MCSRYGHVMPTILCCQVEKYSSVQSHGENFGELLKYGRRNDWFASALYWEAALDIDLLLKMKSIWMGCVCDVMQASYNHATSWLPIQTSIPASSNNSRDRCSVSVDEWMNTWIIEIDLFEANLKETFKCHPPTLSYSIRSFSSEVRKQKLEGNIK